LSEIEPDVPALAFPVTTAISPDAVPSEAPVDTEIEPLAPETPEVPVESDTVPLSAASLLPDVISIDPPFADVLRPALMLILPPA
jgi:hypothetical protein